MQIQFNGIHPTSGRVSDFPLHVVSPKTRPYCIGRNRAIRRCRACPQSNAPSPFFRFYDCMSLRISQCTTLGRNPTTDESCQEFRGQSVVEIEAVHNLRKVRMYLNVLSLRSTSKRKSRKGNLKNFYKIDYSDFLVKN